MQIKTLDNKYTATSKTFSIKKGKNAVIISTWPEAQQSQPYTPKSYTFSPEVSTRQHRWTRDVTVFDTSLPDSGTAFPEPPPPGQMRVGYENYYKTSGILKSDKEYLSFASRGLLIITNLSNIRDNIESAILTMNITNDARNRYATKLFRMTTPYKDFKTTGAVLYSALPESGASGKATVTASKITIDITDLVKDWKSGRYQNYGLMFVGPHEGIAKNNDKHYTIFSRASIKISYKN